MKTRTERREEFARIDKWLSEHEWEGWLLAVIFAEAILLAASVLAHFIPQ